MCGRFTQHHNTSAVAERFDAQAALEISERYNIAPTQMVAAVIAAPAGLSDNAGKGRFLAPFKWGLVPFWAKDTSGAAKMINARSETAHEKPAFRNAFAKRRCLIPADGFYEWQKINTEKQPYHFRRRDCDLYAFAGLWEEWCDPQAPGALPLRTCTILTTSANGVVAPIHDRMPVMLLPEDEAQWLDVRQSPDALRPLLRPYPDALMESSAVGKRVNSPANDDATLLTAL